MNDNGKIEVVNLVGMAFVDNGRSFRFELIDSIPPHSTRLLTFKNTYSIRLCQAGGDEYPIVVIDLTWRAIPEHEKEQILTMHRFPIFDENERPFVHGRRLYVVHIEGTIVGEILTEAVVEASV